MPPENPVRFTPAGADPKQWQNIASKPPQDETGTPYVKAGWQAVLQKLVENPTPEAAKAFNESQFGKTGLDGAELIKMLTGKAPQETGRPLQAGAPKDTAREAERKPLIPGAPAAPMPAVTEQERERTHPIRDIAKKLHEWLQGDPEDMIAKVRSGVLVHPESPLGRQIIAEQEKRIAERDKATKSNGEFQWAH